MTYWIGILVGWVIGMATAYVLSLKRRRQIDLYIKQCTELSIQSDKLIESLSIQLEQLRKEYLELDEKIRKIPFRTTEYYPYSIYTPHDRVK
jgi:hypothetical protein